MDITLEQPLHARLITSEEQQLPAPAVVRYTSADPLAIHMAFSAEICLDGVDITWTYSRGLLWEGLTHPIGEGDVRVWPCGRLWTMIEFYGRGGMALVQFDTEVLRSFLLRTYAAVAAGQEEIAPAIDHCLSTLVGGA